MEDRTAIMICVVAVVVYVVGMTFALVHSPTPNQRCQKQFGGEYYYQSGGLGQDFCTSGSDKKYLNKELL